MSMLRHPPTEAAPAWVRDQLADDEDPAFDPGANDSRGGWFAIRDNSDDWRDMRELTKGTD